MVEKQNIAPDFELRAILAPNPSPMTGPGTTTYMLGRGDVVVIDPGPAIPSHLEAILAALGPDERICAILVTHPHSDHSDLVPDLIARVGAPSYGFGPAGSAHSPQMQELVEAGVLSTSQGVDHAFCPDILVKDGDILRLAGLEIEVIHTPGHMAEHVAFAVGDRLFCGDHVMAWAPSLVSPPDGDMGDYLMALAKILARPWKVLYPTHGEAIYAPAARVRELLDHRAIREAQILSLLDEGPQSVESLANKIYLGLSPDLVRAGSRNILAHLLDLLAKQKVVAQPWPDPTAKFSLKHLI